MPPVDCCKPWPVSGPLPAQSAFIMEKDNNNDDDAKLARKIQQELDDEELAKQLSHEENAERKRRILLELRMANGDLLTDEEVARNLEQELQDERFAHQLSLKESKTTSTIITSALPTNQSTPQQVCSCITCALLLIVITLVVLFVFAGSDKRSVMSPSFAKNDPFWGKNNSQVIPWDNGGKGGLTLEVVGSLDCKWNSEFQTAVDQWDNGSPDALALSISYISADSSCPHILGKLKVCNGDYGDTQWLGINEQLVKNGTMVASVARLNDFYLDNALESQRQYTMCHEIGHGFGLPHTDEDFSNQDSGSCLDYTTHPWVNKQPSSMNFELLNKTYGTVGTRRDLANDETMEHHHPDWVLPAFSKAVQHFRVARHGMKTEQHGWTVLRQSPYGETHTRPLGDGYAAQVQLMFITNQLQ